MITRDLPSTYKRNLREGKYIENILEQFLRLVALRSHLAASGATVMERRVSFQAQHNLKDCFPAWRRSEVLRYTPTVHNEQALMAAFVKRSKANAIVTERSSPTLAIAESSLPNWRTFMISIPSTG